MAMLHMMATEFPMEDFGVAHLNHGLRKEAERESDMVREFFVRKREFRFTESKPMSRDMPRRIKLESKRLVENCAMNFFSQFGV